MAADAEQHVIMQLEHDRKTKLPVKLSWLLDFEKVRQQMNKTSIQQEPLYFFYHNISTTVPSFSLSSYSHTFNAEIPACYKGYVGKKIYGEFYGETTTF